MVIYFDRSNEVFPQSLGFISHIQYISTVCLQCLQCMKAFAKRRQHLKGDWLNYLFIILKQDQSDALLLV